MKERVSQAWHIWFFSSLNRLYIASFKLSLWVCHMLYLAMGCLECHVFLAAAALTFNIYVYSPPFSLFRSSPCRKPSHSALKLRACGLALPRLSICISDQDWDKHTVLQELSSCITNSCTQRHSKAALKRFPSVQDSQCIHWLVRNVSIAFFSNLRFCYQKSTREVSCKLYLSWMNSRINWVCRHRL